MPPPKLLQPAELHAYSLIILAIKLK